VGGWLGGTAVGRLVLMQQGLVWGSAGGICLWLKNNIACRGPKAEHRGDQRERLAGWGARRRRKKFGEKIGRAHFLSQKGGWAIALSDVIG